MFNVNSGKYLFLAVFFVSIVFLSGCTLPEGEGRFVGAAFDVDSNVGVYSFFSLVDVNTHEEFGGWSNDTGGIILTLPEGVYDVNVSAVGYVDVNGTVEIANEQAVTFMAGLVPVEGVLSVNVSGMSVGSAEFSVYPQAGFYPADPVGNQPVAVADGVVDEVGNFSVPLPVGDYVVEVLPSNGAKAVFDESVRVSGFTQKYYSLSEKDSGAGFHSADLDQDWKINAVEISRVVGFYNAGGYQCDAGTSDGFAPGLGNQDCEPHSSDFNPQDWRIGAVELSRLVTFYNAGGYTIDETTDDGFAPIEYESCSYLERRCNNNAAQICDRSGNWVSGASFCIINCGESCPLNTALKVNMDMPNVVEDEKYTLDINVLMDRLENGQVVFVGDLIKNVKVVVEDPEGVQVKYIDAVFTLVTENQIGRYSVLFDASNLLPGIQYTIYPIATTIENDEVKGSGTLINVYRKTPSEKCKELFSFGTGINKRINLVFVGINQNNMPEFLQLAELIVGKENSIGFLQTEPFKLNENNFGFYYVNEIGTVGGIISNGYGQEADYEIYSLASACEVPNKIIVGLLSNEIAPTGGVPVKLPAIYSDVFSTEDLKNNLVWTAMHEMGHAIGGLDDEYLAASQMGLPANYSIFMDTDQCYGGGSHPLVYADCVQNAKWKEMIGKGCGDESKIDCINYFFHYTYDLSQSGDQFILNSMDINIFYPANVTGITVYEDSSLTNLNCEKTGDISWHCDSGRPVSYLKLNIKTAESEINNISIESNGIKYGDQIECNPKESKQCYIEVGCFLDGCTYVNQARSTYNSLMNSANCDPHLYGSVNEKLICNKIYEFTNSKTGVCE